MPVPRPSAAPPAAVNQVFWAVADPTRRRLLDRLSTGRCCVTDLAQPYGMSRPAISQHLRILLDAKLIGVKKIGRHRHYALCPERLKLMYDWVEHYRAFWTGKLTRLGRYLDENP